MKENGEGKCRKRKVRKRMDVKGKKGQRKKDKARQDKSGSNIGNPERREETRK